MYNIERREYILYQSTEEGLFNIAMKNEHGQKFTTLKVFQEAQTDLALLE